MRGNPTLSLGLRLKKENKMENLEQVPESSQWTRLKRKVLAAEQDAKKFYLRRNKTAARRLRKALQEIRAVAKECRQETLELERQEQ